MKKMKTLASLVLALVLAMALTVPAFAAGTDGNITINDPIPEKTYTVYKVFDVVYDSTKTNYSYTIPSDSPWMSTVEKYFTVTAQAANPSVSNAVLKSDYKTNAQFAANFAADLYKAAAKPSVVATWTAPKDNTPKTHTFETGSLGYYFVTTDSGALCNLTNTNPTASIYDKNDKPTIDKTVDDADKVVGVGQVLTYTITGKVPSTTGYESYVYGVHDEMSAGLTFNTESIQVYIDGVELKENDDYTVNFAVRGDNGFNLNIDVMKYQNKVNAPITVTYTATVNANAVDQVNSNKATLTYSNDPATDTTGETTEKTVEVFTGKVVVDKVVGNNDNPTDMSGAKLAGATFVLGREARPADDSGDAMAVGYEYYVNNNGEISWTTEIAKATSYKTDDKGAASFVGLENGTYFLFETAAPEGYNLMTEPTVVTITSADSVATASQTGSVANFTGAVLPSTGGMGTTLFYTIGGLLVVCSAILIVTKKRMSSIA